MGKDSQVSSNIHNRPHHPLERKAARDFHFTGMALSSVRTSDGFYPGILITSYGRAEELSLHSAEYYAELKAAGLDRIHSGFESG